MARSQDLIRAAGGTTGNLFNVPVNRLRCNPKNIRLDTPAFREGIAALARDIKENGFDRSQVLRIRQDESEVGHFIVESGNRRLLATRLAIEWGAAVLNLPAVLERDGMTEQERLANIVLDGEREGYTAAEYAIVIRRFESWGWSQVDIAAKLRKSRQWIINTLETAALPEDVQALVENGAVSATTARAVVQQHGTLAAETIGRVRAETGGKKVTPRYLRVVPDVPEPEPSAESTSAPSATVANAPVDSTADPVVADDLTLAVRRFIVAWDDPNSGGVNEAVAALRRMVS